MVVIKVMEEMPSCCANCEMCLCLDDDISGLCYITQTTNMDRLNSRNSDCPLTEIVTCKECKHNRNGICPSYRHFVDDDFYCANAERRE